MSVSQPAIHMLWMLLKNEELWSNGDLSVCPFCPLSASVCLFICPSVRLSVQYEELMCFFCYFVIITYIYSRIIYYCFVIWFRFAHILAAGVFSASILWPSTSQPAYQLSVRPSSSPSSVSLYFIYGFLDSKLFGFLAVLFIGRGDSFNIIFIFN